jgi:hypothetical protein
VQNHYTTLEVMQDATEREIVYAYRHLARKLHPDLHPDDPDAAERFRAVQEAYDTLKDPVARHRHDTALALDGVVAPQSASPRTAPAPAWRVQGARPGAPRPRRPSAPLLRRPWWEPPLYAVVAFALGAAVTYVVLGPDTFWGVGQILVGVSLLAAVFGLLLYLVRGVISTR